MKWKIGEEKRVKKVKEKLGEGKRQGGAQGWRRGPSVFKLSATVAESFTVQKVLLHSCVRFLLITFPVFST